MCLAGVQLVGEEGVRRRRRRKIVWGVWEIEVGVEGSMGGAVFGR